MKTDKISVSDLFDKQRRYLVPLFQRGYVWTLTDQLEPLWRDIIEQVSIRKSEASNPNKPGRKHFLGAVVFNQINPGIKHVPISEVIDGQQRLTTLQIFLISFRDAIAQFENEFLSAKLRMLTENAGPLPTPIEKHKVWPTNAFRDDFQRIAGAGSALEVRRAFPLKKEGRKKLPRPLLVQGYLFFYEAIMHYLKGEEFARGEEEEIWDVLDQLAYHIQTNKAKMPAERPDLPDPARAEALLDTVTNHIQLVEISLEHEDDPQIIFETLNARGAPLKPADLVRNFVFLYATRKDEDVNAIYEESWKDFDEAPGLPPKSETGRFWKDSERQGRLRNTRLDLFLFHYIKSKTGNDLKIGHIFQEFRDWWEAFEGERKARIELQSIRNAANHFRALVVPDVKNRFGLFAYRLKMLDTATAYPLVLYVKEKAVAAADVSSILQDIESYLVRRAICGLTAKNYNRVFQQLLHTLKADESRPLKSAVREELLSLTGDAAVWPDDQTFEQAWLYSPVYDMFPAGRTRMVLEALEAALHSTKQEYLPIENPMEKPLTIEHVMPQFGEEKDWPPPPLLADGSPNIEAIANRKRALHSFGNLTLLTQPLNSSVSNGAFLKKRESITQESLLKLNAYFQSRPNEERKTWGEAEILIRGKALFRTALGVWPRPH